MKRLTVLFTALLMGSIAYAQSDSASTGPWKKGGVFSINMTQAYYENWTAGGTPSVAGVTFFKAFATYEKKKWRWDNQLDLAYGLIQERQKLMQKTDDRIQFDTKIGYDLGDRWYAAFLTTFKTQFTEGFEDPNVQEVVISNFMSPAYIMASLGFDHNPTDNFSLFFAPAAMKATIVLDQDLADRGAFGVEAGEWETIQRDTTIDSTFTSGKNFRYEFGAHLKAMYKAKVMKNVDFQTKLELYMNYFENFGNVDVNWEGMLDMKINDFLSTNIRVELIYDDDIDILTEVQDDGTELFGPRMQIKQLFALGVNFKF